MSRDSQKFSSAFALSVSMAYPTATPALFTDVRILGGEFVPVFTVRKSLFLSYVRSVRSGYVGFCKRVQKFISTEDSRARYASFNSGYKRISLYTDALSKGAGVISGSVDSDESSLSLIALLFTSGRPLTVIRCVVSVVIAPIQSSVSRAGKHIRLKRSIVVDPPITYPNASPAIVRILRGFSVIAPSFHTLPYRVQFRRGFKRHNFNLKLKNSMLAEYGMTCKGGY